MRDWPTAILLAAVMTAPLHGQVAELRPGATAERAIAGGEKHTYSIEARAGDYIHVKVEQRGIDLSVIGQDSRTYDTELRRKGEEHAELVVGDAGTYTIEVIGKYKTLPAGSYRIVLLEQRQAAVRDLELDRARRLFGEAVKLRGNAKHAEAIAAIRTVLEIRERLLGDHADTASALQLATRIHNDKGDYEAALELAKRALRMREAVLGPDHPDVAVSLNDVGNNYLNMERADHAVSFFQRAIAICEKTLEPDHPVLAIVLMNAGAVYRTRGDLVQAEAVYVRALKIQERVLGPDHRNTAVLANNLGLVYSDRHDYAAALRMFLPGEATIEKLYGRDHPMVKELVTNVANTYTLLGDFEPAVSRYQHLLPMLERTLGPKHPDTAMLMYNFAACLRFQGKLEQSEALYRRVLEIREEMGDGDPGVARTLTALALIAEARGDIAGAVAKQQRAAEITERNVALNLALGSDRERLAYLALVSKGTSQIVSTAIRSNDPESADLAATVNLQRKGRAEDAMAGTFSALRSRLNREDGKLLDDWNGRTAELAKLVLGGPGRASPASHRQRIGTLEEQRERLEDLLTRQTEGRFERSKPITLDAVRSAIPGDAALVEFAVYRPIDVRATRDDLDMGPARYAAFVLRRDEAPRWKDLGDAAEIDRLVAAVRNAMSDPKRSDVRKLARELDRFVFEPLRPWIGNTSHLLLSPDGMLNLFPFSALLDSGGRYLVERYTLSYVTSGRELPKMAAAGPRPALGPPLIVADPWFGEPLTSGGASRRSTTTGKDLSDVYFAPLPGTAEEARRIQTLFPEARLLTGTQATKAALGLLAAPKILHLATHGFFLEDQATAIENPLLRSGLALASANRPAQNGILTALEAAGLNLRGTLLVTLSACDTGLGEVRNGEGVYGFRRALHVAGAETLVMSLWAVSDQATREWMTAYYTGLRNGLGRGEALRQVQLRMLKRHPFYWAGFIQSGAWGPLR